MLAVECEHCLLRCFGPVFYHRLLTVIHFSRDSLCSQQQNLGWALFAREDTICRATATGTMSSIEGVSGKIIFAPRRHSDSYT